MKKVLYISYDGMTDPLGQSQVLPYLKGLSKNGYQFHLISFEKRERFEKHKSQIEEICSEYKINWHPLMYTKRPPLLSTIYDLWKMKRLAYKLHKENTFDIVHCRSYIAALIGLSMKRVFGTKFLFDMRGFWADERIDGKIWNLKNPIFKTVYNFFKRKELEFLSQADAVISLTENAKVEIQSWPTFKDKKIDIQVIPCCVDLDLFDKDKISQNERQQIKMQLGIKDNEYVLGYVGSIGTWYMLKEMLDFFKTLLNSKPEAKFLLVSSENPQHIFEKAKEAQIPNSHIVIQSCLHQQVPTYISLFDASIFFIRPTYSKKASSPTKQGEIMAMGVPIICNAGVGDTDLIVKKFASGNIIEKLNELEYQKYININASFSKTETIKGAHEYFSLEQGVNNYKSMYELVLKDSEIHINI